VKRLSTRRICASCGFNADPFDGGADAKCKRCGGEFVQRTDDSEEVVVKRLKIYDQDTRPLVEYYKNRPTFRAVNGAQSPEKVARDLDTSIDAAASQESKL
jgi:adenylate kinase